MSKLTRRKVLLGGLGLAGIEAAGKARAATGRSLVEQILDAFEHHPVVALGEAHNNQEIHDVLQLLLLHPRFSYMCNAVVVECGNALYQPLVDRFLAGDLVPNQELRKAWRDTTVSAFNTWEAPVYEQIYRAVRAVNRLNPRAGLRLLLGDPPIDWGKISSAVQVVPLIQQRDPHAAQVIEREILAKGKKALVVYGTFHFSRGFTFGPPAGGAGSATIITAPPSAAQPGPQPANPGQLPTPADVRNITDIVESRRPGSVYVIAPATPVARTMEPLLRGVAPFSLVPATGSLGGLSANEVFFSPESARLGGGNIPVGVFGQRTLGQVVNAVLYLGPNDRLSRTQENPAVYRDPEFSRELLRRKGLFGAQNDPLTGLEALLKEQGPQFLK